MCLVCPFKKGFPCGIAHVAYDDHRDGARWRSATRAILDAELAKAMHNSVHCVVVGAADQVDERLPYTFHWDASLTCTIPFKGGQSGNVIGRLHQWDAPVSSFCCFGPDGHDVDIACLRQFNPSRQHSPLPLRKAISMTQHLDTSQDSHSGVADNRHEVCTPEELEAIFEIAYRRLREANVAPYRAPNGASQDSHSGVADNRHEVCTPEELEAIFEIAYRRLREANVAPYRAPTTGRSGRSSQRQAAKVEPYGPSPSSARR